MPVLPAVPSTTVPPGFNSPFSSASFTTKRAARSLTLPPGFWNSAFPRTLHPVSSERRFRRMRGVLPMAARRRKYNCQNVWPIHEPAFRSRGWELEYTFCQAIDIALSSRHSSGICSRPFGSTKSGRAKAPDTLTKHGARVWYN